MFTSLKKKLVGRRAETGRKPARRRQGVRPGFEALESRDLMTLGFGTPPLNLVAIANPNPLPSTLTPAQVRHAYGFDQIPFLQGNYNGTAGQGETIAIVMGNDDPTIRGDLQQFDQQFGLPDPVLTVVNQTGGTTLPTKGSSNQTDEISLDVEWSHAMGPAAKILLVEANSMNTGDLFKAVDYARRQTGVVVVSMSFGVDNGFPGEAGNNSTFTTPAGHSGVAFVSGSGDNGVFSYPSGSPNVLAVGGTVVTLNGDNHFFLIPLWDLQAISTAPAPGLLH